MKKKTITILLGLVTLAMTNYGYSQNRAPIVCHVEGELMTNQYGDDIVICEVGTDLRMHDNPSLHVKAVNGKFSKTIECDHIKKYEAFYFNQYLKGSWQIAPFLVENGTVKIKLNADPKFNSIVRSGGLEGQKQLTLDSLLNKQFSEESINISSTLYDKDHESDYFTPEYLANRDDLLQKWETARKSDMPAYYIDSLLNALNQDNPNKFTPKGLELKNRLNELNKGYKDFEYNYYVEHPMIGALFKVWDVFEYYNDDSELVQRYINLYHDKLAKLYPGHPIHEQITQAETAYNLQPGKPYIDYNVRTNDGKLVPISSLIKGKVALIDLWASWCGPCRRHSIDMIPVYEKYKDKGFTVVAIAREDERKNMEKAVKQDRYPWESLLELNDENQIWRKNGANNSGGAMFLIDQDGTILSTSTDVRELERLIEEALANQ